MLFFYDITRVSKMLFSEIVLFIRSVPKIIDALDNIANMINGAIDRKTDMELALIKERLNALTQKLQTTDDKNELADIVRSLNNIM